MSADGVRQQHGGDMDQTWGVFLTARMAAAGYATVSDLARDSGVHGSVISRWLTAGAVPSIPHLRRLAPILHTPVLTLVVAAGHLRTDEVDGVEGTGDVLAAIAADSALSPEYKRFLSHGYQLLASGTAQQPPAVDVIHPPPT